MSCSVVGGGEDGNLKGTPSNGKGKKILGKSIYVAIHRKD